MLNEDEIKAKQQAQVWQLINKLYTMINLLVCRDRPGEGSL